MPDSDRSSSSDDVDPYVKAVPTHCHRCHNVVPGHWLRGANGQISSSCYRCRGRPSPASEELTPAEVNQLIRKEQGYRQQGSSRQSSRATSSSSIPSSRTRAGSCVAAANSSSTSSRPLSQRRHQPSASNPDTGTTTANSYFETMADSIVLLQEQQARSDDRMDNIVGSLGTLKDMISNMTNQRPGLSQSSSAPTTTAMAPPPVPPGASSAVVTSLYPWVGVDVLDLVARDQLKVEQLVKLRNPESAVVREPPRENHIMTAGDFGQTLLVTDASSTVKTSSFVKAVPGMLAFSQLWTTYMSIRAFYVQDHQYFIGYSTFLGRLIEMDQLYSWEDGLAKYILAVCRKRFGVASAGEWGLDDLHAYNSYLTPALKRPVVQKSFQGKASPVSRPFLVPSHPYASGSGLASGSAPSGNASTGVCFKYNLGRPCHNCQRPHSCMVCNGNHPKVSCNHLPPTTGPSVNSIALGNTGANRYAKKE